MTENLSDIHTSIAANDLRVAVPFYSFSDVAQIADLPYQTVMNWSAAQNNTVSGIFPPEERKLRGVSFMGLTMFMLVGHIRKSGISMQQIKFVLPDMDRKFGMKYAATHKMIGKNIRDDFQTLSEQAIIEKIVEFRNLAIEYAEDGYPAKLKIAKYGIADVIVDPEISFGQPIFRNGGVALGRIISRLRAGESPKNVSEDFGVPLEEVENVWSVNSKLSV